MGGLISLLPPLPQRHIRVKNILIDSFLNVLSKFSSSSSGTTHIKYILPKNISDMISKTVSINTRIIKDCAMKKNIPFWFNRKAYGNGDKND